jgi:hypothetical protein
MHNLKQIFGPSFLKFKKIASCICSLTKEMYEFAAKGWCDANFVQTHLRMFCKYVHRESIVNPCQAYRKTHQHSSK